MNESKQAGVWKRFERFSGKQSSVLFLFGKQNFFLPGNSMKPLIIFFRCLSIKQRLRRKKRSRTHISDGRGGRGDRL